jgi:hypothetical protein
MVFTTETQRFSLILPGGSSARFQNSASARPARISAAATVNPRGLESRARSRSSLGASMGRRSIAHRR